MVSTLSLPSGSARAPRYGHQIPQEVSIHELHASAEVVVAAVRAGERLTLTVDGDPVADIVSHAVRESPWVPVAELRRMRREAPADFRLLGDLGDVRGGLIDTG